MARFKKVSGDAIIANLKVLATFRTQEVASSNLTIREGVFKKTSGKLNLFKGIVRDAEDSLTNKDVLDAIEQNLTEFAKWNCVTSNRDFDILCDARYGFLNLGSKYRGRDTAGGIATLMSTVCKDAKRLFIKRLESHAERRKFDQGIYNAANKTGGTCWALVMDWARRWVLNGKLGFGAKEGWTEKKLLHRGKYISNVFAVPQNQDYASVGDKLVELQVIRNRTPTDLNAISHSEWLLVEYDKDRRLKIANNEPTNTLVDKFKNLSFSRNVGNLGLCEIHIGNQNDKGKNTRIECINNLTNKINSWVAEANAEANAARPGRIAHGINFYFDEKIGFQKWSVNTQRQLDSKGVAADRDMNMFSIPATKIVDQSGGHALGFAYDPKDKIYCFMDPNFGEWVSPDPRKIASIIYDVLKVYTVSEEKNFNDGANIRCICRSINKTEISLFTNRNG